MLRDDMDDALVIGAGSAGLQAALMLGRAGRQVTVLDGGSPRNAPAPAVHNYLGLEGIGPRELLARGRADAGRYGVQIVAGEALDAERVSGSWTVRLSNGPVRRARALVLATGIVEHLPPVEGLHPLWGSDVVACPYCHGWEARGKAVAVLGSGTRAWQQLLLLRRLTEDLVLLSNGEPVLDEAQLAYLSQVGVAVRTDPVARVRSHDGRLAGVEFSHGESLAPDVLFVVTQRRQRSQLVARLGCAVVADGPTAPALVTDASGLTTVANVWAAGSTANPSLTVIGSAGHASTVAIAVNGALIDEEVRGQERS